jgi:hypothetical protein
MGPEVSQVDRVQTGVLELGALTGALSVPGAGSLRGDR